MSNRTAAPSAPEDNTGERTVTLTGMQALVDIPVRAVRADRRAGRSTRAFISGYQGSPLGGFDLELRRQRQVLEPLGIVHQPGLNEELAATAVVGSQIATAMPSATTDGVIGFWYGKAPGLDRASDAIRHANFVGTSARGGAVAFVGDDPACKSSSIPSRSEEALADLGLPTFTPGNLQEVVEFGAHAVALSRASGLWVALQLVTAVADGSGTMAIDDGGTRLPILPPTDFVPTVRGQYTVDALLIEEEIRTVRLPLAAAYASLNTGINEVTTGRHDATIAIAAAGHTYYETIEALRSLGLPAEELERLGVKLIRFGLVHPLDPADLRRLAGGVTHLAVVEEKRPFLERAFRDAYYGRPDAPRINGQGDGTTRLLPNAPVLTADVLVGHLASFLQHAGVRAEPAPSPRSRSIPVTVGGSRTPYVCSGCPHSTGLKVPSGAKVGGGIGCHGMVVLMPTERVGDIVATTQMGGEGAEWIGMEPFVSDDHFTQNLGDGTFFHSGSLAIRAAVAAGSHITFKLLYNSAVAMTGGQHAPGSLAVPQLASMLLDEGVRRVIVTTDDRRKYRRARLPRGVEAWDRSRILEAQEQLRSLPGVTVLIHDQQCAIERRRERRRSRDATPETRVVINDRVCEGCGDCVRQSNCISLQPLATPFGDKTTIDQDSCNLDYACLDGDCPSFVTVSRSRTVDRPRHPFADTLQRAELPDPDMVVPPSGANIRMLGIGGTGVVTIAHVLARAATLDGKHVWGLDQTGLSQKGGPVVSDARITDEAVAGTNRALAGTVDTMLVFDGLAVFGPLFDGATPDRTVAVVSTDVVPTAAMVATGSTGPDLDELRRRVDTSTRAAHNRFVAAASISAALFGTNVYANTVLLGSAFQQGGLPLSAAAIESAIAEHGLAVEDNTLAFRAGRAVAADEAVAVELLPGAPRTGGNRRSTVGFAELDHGRLGQLLHRFVPDLEDYHDAAYARRYVECLARIHRAEQQAGSAGTPVTEACAVGLHHLMAYKDEYEVARLHLRHRPPELAADRRRVRYHLHPPVLRSMGMRRKLRLPAPVAEPAFRALVAMRRLRGTAADPFGRSEVRRTERRLVEEYIATMERLADRLADVGEVDAVELASLPMEVRGYEEIKLEAVERYDRRRGELLARLGI